jgi:hypothetical protein
VKAIVLSSIPGCNSQFVLEGKLGNKKGKVRILKKFLYIIQV